MPVVQPLWEFTYTNTKGLLYMDVRVRAHYLAVTEAAEQDWPPGWICVLDRMERLESEHMQYHFMVVMLDLPTGYLDT